MVAVNPFKRIDGIYDAAKSALYVGKDGGAEPPHIFAVADAAFTAMTTQTGDAANQVWYIVD